MKTMNFIVLILGVLLAACNKPAPVELQQEDTDGLLEVSAIAPSDSNFAFASVDSGAILPADRERFAGLLQLVHLTFNTGQRIIDTAYARALFENRDRPVRALGRIIGYHGINLGSVSVGGTPLIPILHRVGRLNSTAGIEYIRDMTALYQPRMAYTWAATPDSIGPISTTIETPENIVVHSPAGGTIIHRDRNLLLNWTGQGNLFFVISAYDPLGNRSRPLFNVRVRRNIQRAVLSRKILRLLPPQRIYVFTFVLANMNEMEIAGFRGRVLVQATSLYNSYVELR